MKKYLALLFAVSVLVLPAQISFAADWSSAAYTKAVQQGDMAAAYKAQSYLEPPYCYDLNRWHGVKFTKFVNGRVVQPSFPFIYQDMAHLKVRKLYDRAGLDDLIRTSRTELELIGKISDWANKHWGHVQPLPYPAWDALEILDKAEKGDAFWCTFKAALFVQACNAAGLTARMLGINPFNEAAHTVTEVYSNEFRKWMLVDPWINCWFEKDGIPLSALEVHKARFNIEGVYLHFGANGRGTESWDVKAGKASSLKYANARIPAAEDPGKGLLNMYDDYRVVMRNDHTVHPQSKENVFVDGFMVPYNSRGGEWWGPQLHWVDDFTPPQITCWNSGEVGDFQWPLNEVKVDLAMVSPMNGDPVVLQAKLSTNTPNFDRYLLEVDGKSVPIEGDVYVWTLNKGTNSLKVTSLNAIGRKGFPSEFVIEYDPAPADRSRKVTVELKNPGFENAAPAKDKAPLTPSNWASLCSNPFGCREFALDSKVKHSGKFSLRATPAKDPRSGVEYAFIVHSGNFPVNAATDVIYSVWLRADKENTPVDVALLEAEYKGQGTYVQRVTVGKEWKQYELKCRLHNGINVVYVGYKVYTGTVWADDAAIVEVKR